MLNQFSNANGKGKKKLKGIFRLWEKYNPALATARNGALLGIKELNLFGIATRNYPAFLTPAEAQAKHIKVSSIEPAKRSLEQLRKFWERMGGKPSALDAAIKKGARHKVKKLNKTVGVDGDVSWNVDEDFSNFEPISTGALITAGMTLLTNILHIANKAGADKNPFEAGSDAANQFNKDNSDTPPPTDSKNLADLEKAADEDKAKGLGLDDGENNKIWWYVGGASLLALTIGVGIWYWKKHKNN